MKNENAKLVFLRALIGSVESYTDVTHKVPAKVYFNFPISDLDIRDQKAVLTELKKKKIITGFKFDDGDFIVSKPSRSMLKDYFLRLKDKPAPKLEKPVDTKIRFYPVVTGKSKPKMIAPKTQKSRHNAEIPVMVSNEPSAVILDTVWGA